MTIFDPPGHQNRLAACEVASARLAALDDVELEALIQGGEAPGEHIGGRLARLELDGVPVFVKRVPLTDLERAPEHFRSTANVFGLPTFYQYGVGSTGFGAWRELAASLMASDWVRSGECTNFPLLYHWRVLPRAAPPAPTEEERESLDRAVEYWNGSQEIRARREAIRAASASIALCLEYIPQTLEDWLAGQVALGAEVTEAALRMVDSQLTSTAAFMNARGMLHFDLHCRNALTDGRQVYVGDFGLATCSAFALSAEERASFERHRNYDRCYVPGHLIHWFDAARGPLSLSPDATALLDSYRPVAGVMGKFFHQIRNKTKLTPYPAEALEAALPERLRQTTVSG